MKANKQPRSKWPRIHQAKHRSGRISYQVDLGFIDGKRKRENFKTRPEAETRAELARVQRDNEGTSAFSLPKEVRFDAAKANALLAPHSVTIYEAAKYYKEHVLAYKTAPLVSAIVDEMIAEATRKNSRPDTIKDLKCRLTLFAEDFGNSRLSEVTVAELKEWLDDEEWGARNRINYHTKLSQLFNYAVKNNWVDSNLTERIDRPTAEEKTPEIFTVDQANSLLSHANDFGLLPYIAMGLFAGLRSTEMFRLDIKAINSPERSIVVGAEVAKKRSRRVVQMEDALLAWLLPVIKDVKSGPIVEIKQFRKNMQSLQEAAAISNWPNNGLRHSFASYHLAYFENDGKTAMQMGHRSTNIVHNHYKSLVLKSEAEKFWNLRPQSEVKSTNEQV